jgi:hypothetical protein
MRLKDENNQLTIWFFVALWLGMVILNSSLDLIRSPSRSFDAWVPILGAHAIGHLLGILLVWFLYRWWMSGRSQP